MSINSEAVGRCDSKSGGLNVQSIKKHSNVLKQIFAEAVIAEQTKRNPAGSVPLPKQDRQAIKGVFLTGSEANNLLRAFAGHELQVMIYVTLYYGLRRSDGYVKHTLKNNLLVFYEWNPLIKKSYYSRVDVNKYRKY